MPTQICSHLSMSADGYVTTALLIYDNPDTREQFFGPGSEPLHQEMDALMNELRESGELIATEPLADLVQTAARKGRVGLARRARGPPCDACST